MKGQVGKLNFAIFVKWRDNYCFILSSHTLFISQYKPHPNPSETDVDDWNSFYRDKLPINQKLYFPI